MGPVVVLDEAAEAAPLDSVNEPENECEKNQVQPFAKVFHSVLERG